MGCKCCRWPVNACRMARLVRLLPLSFGGLVLFLALHSFYNDSIITGALLLLLFLPAHIQLGSTPGVVVASARLAKEVLKTQDEVFASRPDSLVTWAKQHFAYYNKDSGARYNMHTAKPGPFLTKMRSLVAVELMAPERIEFFKSMLIRKRYHAKDMSAETRKKAFQFKRLLATVVIWASRRPSLQDFIRRLHPAVISLISSNEREMTKLAKQTDESSQTQHFNISSMTEIHINIGTPLVPAAPLQSVAHRMQCSI